MPITVCKAVMFVLLISVGSMGQESSRFACGLISLTESRFFDLDTGGVFPTPSNSHGVECEFSVVDDELKFDGVSRGAPEFETLLPVESPSAWRKITTSSNRVAWYQVLSSGKTCCFRYVVRMQGQSDPLPAPRNCVALGKGSRIDVHFEGHQGFEAYVVERRVRGKSFSVQGRVKKAPFRDESVEADTRYFYRVRGVNGQGDVGLAARATASVDSNGALRGEVSMPLTTGRRAVDLVLGAQAPVDGDIRLRGTYGGASGAAFYDYLGREVFACDPENPSPWTRLEGPNVNFQIPPATPFCIPIRGGGQALCHWSPAPSSGVMLHYDLTLSSGKPVAGPGMTVETVEREIRVSLAKLKAFPNAKLTASYGPGHTRNLALKDGVATLDFIPNRFFLFRAVASDSKGRMTSQSEHTLNTFEKKLIAGTLELNEGEGVMFGYDELAGAVDADLVLADYRGDITGTIASVRGRGLETGSDRALFDALVGCDPKGLSTSSGGRFSVRARHSRVFVVRTKRGGWAKIFIVQSARDRTARSGSVEIDYVFNPFAPVFSDETGDVTERAFTFNAKALAGKAGQTK